VEMGGRPADFGQRKPKAPGGRPVSCLAKWGVAGCESGAEGEMAGG